MQLIDHVRTTPLAEFNCPWISQFIASLPNKQYGNSVEDDVKTTTDLLENTCSELKAYVRDYTQPNPNQIKDIESILTATSPLFGEMTPKGIINDINKHVVNSKLFNQEVTVGYINACRYMSHTNVDFRNALRMTIYLALGHKAKGYNQNDCPGLHTLENLLVGNRITGKFSNQLIDTAQHNILENFERRYL